MPVFSSDEMARLLLPYFERPAGSLLNQLSVYLDLLLKWNERTNLTAIREPGEMVRRHFGESLFLAKHLPERASLLDFGSGAGFPGLPVQLARPELRVVLAESQQKKASFLREVVRTLGLRTEVWAARVEAMPPERLFDMVTLRAVDVPKVALQCVRERLVDGGKIYHLCIRGESSGLAEIEIVVPQGRDRILRILDGNVPRGT